MTHPRMETDQVKRAKRLTVLVTLALAAIAVVGAGVANEQAAPHVTRALDSTWSTIAPTDSTWNLPSQHPVATLDSTW